MTTFFCRACGLLLTNGHCLHARILGERVIPKPNAHAVLTRTVGTSGKKRQ